MAKEDEIDSPEVLDARISVVRGNLRELVAQAFAHSGAAGEHLLSQHVLEQERGSRNGRKGARRLDKCVHLSSVRTDVPRTNGCEECMKAGDFWVHLRLCRTCGHVGCCDESKNKHATKHFHQTKHPIITSLELGEGWSWCHVDAYRWSLPEPTELADG